VSVTGPDGLALLGRAVLAACAALEEAQEELCRLDAVAGDGDEGFAMANAARGVRAQLAKAPPGSAAGLVDLVANQFSVVGGTMGALSFVLFRSLSQAPGLGRQPLSAGGVAQLLAIAEDAVSAFGEAQRGDKTVIDAIAGAREAAETCARAGETTSATLVQSAEGAVQAAARTADMVPKVGRASRLVDKSRGTIDPGAQSFAIALSALAQAYATAADDQATGTEILHETATPSPGAGGR
jgi:dihydroxyacetone kinase